MNKLIALLVCCSCLYMNVQPFRLYFDGGQALSMFIPTLIILVYDKLWGNKSIIYAILYTIIVFSLRSLDVEYFNNYLSQIMSMFFSICCIEHFFKHKDLFFAKSVLLVYYGSLIIMALISIPQFYLFPDMTRELLFAENAGTRIASRFYWSIAYSSMHEIPLLLIPLVAIYKSTGDKMRRFVLLISIIILYVALMLGDATTPLLLATCIIFVLILYKKSHSISYNLKRLALISACLFCVLNKYILIFILSTIQPIFEGTTNYKKIDDSINQIVFEQVEENSNLGQRDLVYTKSKEVFFSHPFGIEEDINKIGMHSFIIDHLAVLGLILIIPLVILTIQRYKIIILRLKYFKYYYIVCYISFILMASFKNFFLKIDAWFIVPLLLLTLETYRVNKLKNKQNEYCNKKN